jgi:hypothetical protein
MNLPIELTRARPDQANMQTEDSIPPKKNPRVRIIWLICIHITLGLLLGAITAATGSGPGLLSASFVGLVLSQTSLLGIWGGSGTNRWWIRLVGVLVGVGYLGPQFGTCIDELDTEIVLLVAFATFAVASVLLVVGCFGPRIRLVSDEGTPTTRVQFSIRHLMILTFVLACLLALAKWLQPALDLRIVPILLLIGLALALVGLVAVWAILGTKHPLAGTVVLLPVAAGTGLGVATFLPGPEFAIWMTATLTEALSLVVSLFVIRSCGYRLRRRSAPRPGGDPM